MAVSLLLLGSACGADPADTDETAAATETNRSSSTPSAHPNDKAAKEKDKDKSTESAKPRKESKAADRAERTAPSSDASEEPDGSASDGRDSDDADASGTGEGGAESPTPEGTPPGALTVTGGPFESLSFPNVQCAQEESDLYLQSRSNKPAVVVTVLFNGGGAAHASLQTDSESGPGTTWSDEETGSLSASVRRDEDTVTFTDAVLTAFDGDGALTVSGTLTCTGEL